MSQPRDFGFREEEQMVRDSARKLLSENAGIERLRKLVAANHHQAYESDVPPDSYDQALWRQMVDLGWTALSVPESAGGAGMKMVAVAALAEEAGRAALPSPLISTLIATCVLREAATATAHAWLGRIVEGHSASLAITNAAGSWEVEDTDVRVNMDGPNAVLDGTAWFVQDARKASFFIVSARSDGGTGLYVVAADSPGLSVHPDRIVDLTRDQGRVELEHVAVLAENVIVPVGGGNEVLRRAWPAVLTIVAADLCGAGEWQLQTTSDYARVRKQFDHELGFFQAVKHPLVNMMIDVDRARSLVYAAACAIDTEPERAEYYARMAKSAASDMAAFCSGRSVQLHGGIGFTWECDVHLYFKRQRHNQMLYGDGVHQRGRLARLIP
jgi:alkylation response protein AidB-like acyl-CoA dehydrogenase